MWDDARAKVRAFYVGSRLSISKSADCKDVVPVPSKLPAHLRQAPLPPLSQAQRLAPCPLSTAPADNGGNLRHSLGRLRGNLFDHLDSLLNGLLNDHFPGPATATWSAFSCLDGTRGAANARQLLGLGSGLRLKLLRLCNYEARQDATVFLNGLGERLRGNRSGIE